jgi:glycosyltransferase involved in cell wall biosynthesis
MRVGECQRLLFVVNAHEFTAAHRLPLLRGAEAAGFSVETVAPGGSPAAKRLEREQFVVHPVGLSRRGLRVLEESGALRELTDLYRRLAPDLVHHATIKPVLYGSVAAHRANVPAVVNAITGLGYVYTAADWRSRLLRRLVDRLYRWALQRHPRQRVIFQNRDDWELLERIGALDPRQAVLIPGAGVDVSAFAPADAAAEPPLVVMPGRLIWDKGVREFAEAAERLHSIGVSARFALVGDIDRDNARGVSETDLRQWTDSGVLEWWGGRDDMPEVYSQASIVVLPSFYREGLPKVLLEAAACGLPVVTTDSPGCRDAVVDGETGYLVPTRDSASLADRIGELLADPELRHRMGHAGRKRAETEFSTERVVADTLAVYEELLGSGRTKRQNIDGAAG